jgi:hypothetical protein
MEHNVKVLMSSWAKRLLRANIDAFCKSPDSPEGREALEECRRVWPDLDRALNDLAAKVQQRRP